MPNVDSWLSRNAGGVDVVRVTVEASPEETFTSGGTAVPRADEAFLTSRTYLKFATTSEAVRCLPSAQVTSVRSRKLSFDPVAVHRSARPGTALPSAPM